MRKDTPVKPASDTKVWRKTTRQLPAGKPRRRRDGNPHRAEMLARRHAVEVMLFTASQDKED